MENGMKNRELASTDLVQGPTIRAPEWSTTINALCCDKNAIKIIKSALLVLYLFFFKKTFLSHKFHK
jgi:hypothetical protein